MTSEDPDRKGSQSSSPSIGQSQTERESSVLTITPGKMTDTEKRIFAWRRWCGIGPGGHKIEEWTQREIAAYLGVSVRTVRRWVNEEPAPVFEGLTERQRMTLFSMAVTGNDAIEGYLKLLELDGEYSA